MDLVVLLYFSGLLLTLLCVFGSIGNILTMFILNSNPEMRSQTINVYLTFLSIQDLGVLVNTFLMLALPDLWKLIYIYRQEKEIEEIQNFVTMEQQGMLTLTNEILLHNFSHAKSPVAPSDHHMSAMPKQLTKRREKSLRKRSWGRFPTKYFNGELVQGKGCKSLERKRKKREKSHLRCWRGIKRKRMKQEEEKSSNELLDWKDTLHGFPQDVFHLRQRTINQMSSDEVAALENKTKKAISRKKRARRGDNSMSGRYNEVMKSNNSRSNDSLQKYNLTGFENPSHQLMHLVYPLALTAQTGSVWMTCLITFERYFAVSHPLESMVLSTKRRAIMASSLVSVGALLYNLPRFFEVNITTNEVTGLKQVNPSSLRSNQTYYFWYHVVSYTILINILPLSVLSFLNVKIYSCIKAASVDRSTLSSTQRSELNISSMLVFLVAVFIICEFPAFIVNLIDHLGYDNYVQTTAIISNLLICFNSSINVIIYCIYGKKFRKQFKETICRCKQNHNSPTNRSEAAVTIAIKTLDVNVNVTADPNGSSCNDTSRSRMAETCL